MIWFNENGYTRFGHTKVGRWIGHRRVVRALWRLVYHRWMDPADEIVCVVGWRTALIDTRGQRRTMTTCFWWFD